MHGGTVEVVDCWVLPLVGLCHNVGGYGEGEDEGDDVMVHGVGVFVVGQM